ncbi:TetR/AcrR family transcriptional regulator [Saccharothrix violaceirubra]|uniref:AcrR family transcriptional regulator n=1 Tax=Saccharothrix violaceirubra TaxID=413306 RepID=A0A7W7TA60_9PSEU|nr:TetR/AcrR family transcriptional regulator [Saccharothrix violaceirubra]MBB4969373.1 AcrR family transcriptional regulator [Saccharothrix violaceirubra]
MPRPRSITDERLLVAAAQVVGRRGPEFTIADVAAEAGVSVGTVSGRFGSKSGLLQELTRRETARIPELMRAAAEGLDPVAGLRAGLRSWIDRLGDPETAGNNLAQLGVDLIDPELRGLLALLHEATERGVRDLVERADLPRGPGLARAARVLTGLLYGVAMDWSIRPAGALTDRLDEDVDAVLDAWKGS